MTQLEKLKLKTNETNEDLLTLLLEDAESYILDYTNRKELLPKMESLHRDLAAIYYNRIGSEGEASRNEGGVSVSYINDIPGDIKSRLNAYRLSKLVGVANED